jgi:hypothetical protein
MPYTSDASICDLSPRHESSGTKSFFCIRVRDLVGRAFLRLLGFDKSIDTQLVSDLFQTFTDHGRLLTAPSPEQHPPLETKVARSVSYGTGRLSCRKHTLIKVHLNRLTVEGWLSTTMP